ncbi:hypothetical protein Q3G72_011752 [Acer saccharum]|nr:hypothetical protein Q3G72_011752 [Acer saccharum]
MGKVRHQKQLGKNSSDQEGGRSISTSDRSVRDGGILRIDRKHACDADRAESGGSVEKMDGRNEGTNQRTEEPSDSFKDKGVYLPDPSPVGDTITGDCNQRLTMSSLEKMSCEDVEALEEAGTYVKQSDANMLKASRPPTTMMPPSGNVTCVAYHLGSARAVGYSFQSQFLQVDRYLAVFAPPL